MLADPAAEATFVPADPPREGWLALWGSEATITRSDAELEVVLPAGSGVRRRRVAARRIPIAAALDPLVELPAIVPTRPSMGAWSTAARLAVELAGRGRLLPAMSAAGVDAWRLGPLDPEDVERRRRLAAALPPAAHALAVPGSRPLRVWSPLALTEAFSDAVADVLPRTATSVTFVGHPAFAAGRAVPVDNAAGWLASLGGSDEEASVALRLELPVEVDGRFRAVLTLQSSRDPSLVIEAAELWAAPEVVLARFGDADTALLLALRRGARVWPPMARLLEASRPAELELDDTEVDDLLGKSADELASAGIQVLWPAELLLAVELRPVVSTPAPAAVTGAGFSLEALLELRWRATVDGEQLTEEELRLLAEAKRPVVRLRGRWVRADPERFARVRTRHRIGAGAILAAALGGDLAINGERVEATVEGPIAALANRLRAFSPERARTEPPGLSATLRPYQRRGLAWLAEMADLTLGGVLADDMGLGKTIQMLALHLVRDRGRPTLVVCFVDRQLGAGSRPLRPRPAGAPIPRRRPHPRGVGR